MEEEVHYSLSHNELYHQQQGHSMLSWAPYSKKESHGVPLGPCQSIRKNQLVTELASHQEDNASILTKPNLDNLESSINWITLC